jgi:hypothetical protein
MKNNKALFILLAGLTLTGAGCKKFLDVNNDPNHPLTVAEKLALPDVELTTTTQVVGGFNGTTTAYWMQQLSLNQPFPDIETYLIKSADVDNTWSFYLYPNIFENLDQMMATARTAGHNEYLAIGKILFAYNLAIATDAWGDIPYSEALKPLEIPKPKYDKQEDIYKGIQALLDSGIYFTTQPASAIKPGADDLIYGGKMASWSKFAYMLKARYYLRLTKAPGYTAAAQADLALAALQHAFTGNADNARIAYAGGSQQENPWYENTLPGAGGVTLAKYFVDFLVGNDDPRLPIIADTANDGTYKGRPSGIDQGLTPDYTAFSVPNTFYGGFLPLDEDNDAGSSAPLWLATYSEQKFIEAEATFYKSGAAVAQPIYEDAIKANMQLLGVAAGDITTYIGNRPALTAGNAIEQIINEKYVADFLSLETWNDWRRTGFPTLPLAQNAYTNYIPRRWPYAFTPLTTNPQPEQDGVTTATRVWWDAQ